MPTRPPADATVSVVVVDDQPPFRDAARAVIARTPGFVHVGEAATGEDGVALASATRADLVLMDIKLPGIDGLAATRRILDLHPTTVVLLCSTYDEASLPAGTDACGAAAYVHKEELGPRLLRRLWDEHAAAPDPAGG